MKLGAPKLVQDVYSDLRDRRLLVVAIALIAAMIAVPFLVKGTSTDPGSASAPGGVQAPAGFDPLEPVALAETSELRDYRQRLSGLQSRNPFKQQLTGAVRAATRGDGGADSTPLPTQESDGPLASGIEDTASPSVGTPPASTDVVPVAPVEPPVEEPVEQPPIEEPETTLYTTRIDVRVGPVGDTRVLEDVKELSYLPDRQVPVVQYLLSDLELTDASFVVSPAVVGTEGEGKCQPTPQACQFLLLEVGEEQSLEYEDGTVYRLKLVGVTLHEEPFESTAEPDGAERNSSFAVGRSVAGLSG